MTAREIADKWFQEHADIRLDVVDANAQAWEAAILFCAKFAEGLKVDRMGKLGEFQVADKLRELLVEEES